MECGSSVSNAVEMSWIDSVAIYMKEVRACSLDLTEKKLETEDFELLVKHLPGSQVRELILAENDLANKMKVLSEVLVKTEVQKLNVSECSLTKEDVFELMEVLKDTKITELHITGNGFDVDHDYDTDSDSDSDFDDNGSEYFNEDEKQKFLSLLRESHLQAFYFDLADFFDTDSRVTVCEAIASTKIFRLCTQVAIYFCQALIPLFSSLHRSSLTDLKIDGAEYEKRTMKILSQALRNSNLKKLHLNNCDIPDDGVDILAEGLVHSKITELYLNHNIIRGSNTLGLYLKDTQIKILTLNGNNLDQQGIFLSPKFLKLSHVVKLELRACKLGAVCFRKLMKSLKFSKVTELDLSLNNLEDLAICKLAKILKKTNLERVSLAENKLSQAAAVALAEGIKGSKLKHIDLSHCFKHPEGGILLPLILSEARGSTIDSLDFRSNGLNEAGAKTLAVHLENTTFTRLDLSNNDIKSGAPLLGNHLKFTALSHLNLCRSKITDEGVGTLAACLKDSQLIELLLDDNKITCRGAESLALSLKTSKLLCLSLKRNKIRNSGLRALAKGAENTFITDLSVKGNPEAVAFLMIDAVVCRNKVSIYHLCRTFKKIAPRSEGVEFCFTSAAESSMNDFLDDCLELYKNMINEPAAIGALLKDESILYSKKKIMSLMLDEFPKQFSHFIASKVDAEASEHVILLKKAEDWGLSKIVELLLLNRPLYMVDRNESILHPYVYQLLNKYNYPLCNTDIEPEGKTKIIDYFRNSDIEGASDIVCLLEEEMKL